jgi:peptidoglycan hydrolase-like protein with peptidoglycan-binding domain
LTTSKASTYTPSVTTPSIPTIPETLLAIPFGSRNSSVTVLQNYLIQYGYLSKGLNTGYYGTLTQTAVSKYRSVTTNQQAITAPTAPVVSSPIAPVSGSFTRTLTLGSTGADVKQLQQFLNSHGFIVASTGNGSKGHETTYYGPATAAAISRFQLAHFSTILAPYGLTRGTGSFGPATMKVVNAF